MRHIEKARRAADVKMLPDDAARILQRHLIAREGHELCAEFAMERVERRHAKLCFRLDEDFSFAHGRFRDVKALRFRGTAPPLSRDLRDFTRAFRVYPFGETRVVSAAAFQSAVCVRSFCLRVSGAVAPSAPAWLVSPACIAQHTLSRLPRPPCQPEPGNKSLNNRILSK